MTSSGERFKDVELGNKRLPACYGYLSSKLIALGEAMVHFRSTVPEIDQYVKLAKKHCTHPNDHNLTKEEAAAIYLYTMEMSEDASVYRILNQTLRKEDRSLVRPWFSYLKLFDTATSKLPKFKGTLWRGIDKNVSHSFKKGQKITWWSISSCSKSVNVIKTFIAKSPQSTLFNVECSNGKLISAYTCFPNEDEVILMPGTIFEVVSDPLDHSGGLNIVHLKEIVDDEHEDDPQSNVASANTSVTKKMEKMNIGIVNIPANARWKQNGVTVAGGNGSGNATNQLYNPHGLFVDDDQTVIIADFANYRVVQWKKSDTNGEVIAGGNDKGNRLDQLNCPTDVLIDKETENLIIADRSNQRVVRWSCRNGTKQGEILIDRIDCWGLAMDDQRYLYVSDTGKHAVRRYQIGDTNGTLVAGGNGKGNGLNQLSYPYYLFVDRQQNVYVSEMGNHRVMKWNKGAKEGIVVAGGNESGNALTHLYYPEGIFVDTLGTLYVADCQNHRVIRWSQGDKQGTVIVGGNGRGAAANQFTIPRGLSFDRHGNLYVVDNNNNRVQRFDIIN